MDLCTFSRTSMAMRSAGSGCFLWRRSTTGMAWRRPMHLDKPIHQSAVSVFLVAFSSIALGDYRERAKAELQHTIKTSRRSGWFPQLSSTSLPQVLSSTVQYARLHLLRCSPRCRRLCCHHSPGPPRRPRSPRSSGYAALSPHFTSPCLTILSIDCARGCLDKYEHTHCKHNDYHCLCTSNGVRLLACSVCSMLSYFVA